MKDKLPDAPYFDLLDAEVEFDLRTNPKNLMRRVPARYKGPIILDEIQKIPQLLDEVHRVIETKKGHQFVLTGSSARKLRREGVNLLAGRALVTHFHPLTVEELGEDFDIKRALQSGLLPSTWGQGDPKKYLASYIQTYLDQEVKQEGMSRNIVHFSKFLQAASFSQASLLNISAVAADCGVDRRSVTNYFDILKDLLIAHRIPVFSKKAKRELLNSDKFYFFDCGVFRALRPRGPLDSDSELNGAALETLVLQNLMAINDYRELEFEISHWHTRKHVEVDFVLYGPRGLFAIEIKSGDRVRSQDFHGLLEFGKDYPMAKLMLLYGGDRHYRHEKIEVIPVLDWLRSLTKRLS